MEAIRVSLESAFGVESPCNLTEAEKRSVLGGIPTLESLCSRLKAGRYKRTIVMVGAGVSVAAGIPDFRTPGSGLYYNLEKYSLPRPQAVFEMDYFRKNPQPFFSLAKELYPIHGRFTPTKAHYFIMLLAKKGYLLRCYSQVAIACRLHVHVLFSHTQSSFRRILILWRNRLACQRSS